LTERGPRENRPFVPDGAAPGFTIMEVVVAIMILAVSVVSIFGAQFATVATTDYSQHLTQAMQIARCRMSEIELEIQLENGFEESDVETSGDCCEFMENESEMGEFTCRWEIKTVELPDMAQLLSGGADGGGGMLSDFGMDLGGSPEEMGPLGMVASFAPMLSEMLKQAIRRVTVTVEWEKGGNKKEFTLAQYLTHPTQGPLQLMHSAANAADMYEAMNDPESDNYNPSGAGTGIPGGAMPPIMPPGRK
jgi:hypothetical protein